MMAMPLAANVSFPTPEGGTGKPFWEANISIILPVDINLRWQDYREIVQPDKASFWVMLGCLALLIAWITFLTYYMSRVFGPIVAFIFTRFARLRGYDVHISIGSFSLSLLSGKVMFRDFRWICRDYSFICNDGWIIFSYWNYVPSNPTQHNNNVSRLHLSFNGLQLHLYNRLSSYRRLAKYFGLGKLFGPPKDDVESSIKTRKLTKREELEWDKYYDKLWSLIGYIKLDISSGRFVAGNATLPSMMVLSFENYTSKIFLKEYGKGADRALLSVVASVENVRVALVKCYQFAKKRPSNYTGRCDPPPRTMGDGFAVLQTAHLNFYYNQSIVGVVKERQQSLTKDLPVWESVWRFDKNTIFSYGPWADSQRVQLYDFFFPPEYRSSEVTLMPREGERRILLAHDMRVSLLNDAAIDIWFMRDEELNALHLRVKQGSSVDLKLPWVTSETGFDTTMRCCLLFVESSTSLLYPKFFQCETLRLTLNVHYPRTFNGHQMWKYALEVNKISAWFVWDHKRFFTDLINEWTSDSVVDLYKFVPYTWDFVIHSTDSFEIFIVLNENNWIDTSSLTSAENHLAAIVGKNARCTFALPFVDFCPETVNMKYRFHLQGFLGLRMWLPPKSPLFAVLHALMKNAVYETIFPGTSSLPTISDLDEDWVEIWRTESAALLFDFTYHPIYRCGGSSDCPASNENQATDVAHPRQLPPDHLLVELEIAESEVLVVGLIIKLIIDLKNNYFGLYDALTDVADGDADTISSLYGNVDASAPEKYRPMALRLWLRVAEARGFCLMHCSKMASVSTKCPEITVDQIVLEIAVDPLEVQVQVTVDSAVVCLMTPPTLSQCTDGVLALKTFSFRGQALLSELEVHWDAAVVEYGWLMEIVIDQFVGNLHPLQIPWLMDCVESILLLAACPDEESLVPEKYDICYHMNDIRTCPKSALNLFDRKGRIQNCESDEKLKYKLFRIGVNHMDLLVSEERSAVECTISPLRLAYCNCHRNSFCSNVLFRVPLISLKEFACMVNKEDNNWIECGSLQLAEVTVDVHLPYAANELHIIQEKKNFLLKHDKATERLYFLWNDGNSCACFGQSFFFGAVDKVGIILLNDLSNPIPAEGIAEKTEQPVIGQSIVYESRRIILPWKTARKTHPVSDFRNRKEEEETTISPSESFHSAFSSSDVNLYHHMASPILSSSILLESYALFLNKYRRRNIDTNNTSAVRNGFFEMVNVGMNGLKLSLAEEKPKQTVPQKNASVQSPKNSSPGLRTLDINATFGSSLNIFISPLELEVIQRIFEQVASSLSCLHPAFIVQHLYTICTFKHHAQPLTMNTEVTNRRNDFQQLELSGRVALPSVNVVFFQSGLIEKTIHSTSLQDSLSHLARTNVALMYWKETTLVFSNETRTEEFRLFYEWRGHMQFLQLVETAKFDFAYNKSFSPLFTTNWNNLMACNNRLNGFDLRVVADADLPELKLIVNAEQPNCEQKSPSSNAPDRVTLTIQPIEMAIGLCKPIDQTTTKEWPIFDVFAPCVTAWAYAVERLDECLMVNLAKIDESFDFALAKMLSEVMDCNDDQIFKFEKSCFFDVKVHSRAAASCPSCILSIILLRYASREDVEDCWQQMDLLEVERLFLKEKRKQALVALLSHWQTIVCSQIKIANAETANKYLKQLAQNYDEVRITVEPDVVSSPDVKSNGESSARANDNRQMDLYHWILAKHRERKEISVRKSMRKLLDDAPVNTMEIVLSVFFWSFYEARRLEPSCVDMLLPMADIGIDFIIEIVDLKVDIVEPRMVFASNISYLSLTRHHLLHLESFSLTGNVQTELHLDEFQLRPVRVSIRLSNESTAQNVHAVFSFAAVCLFNDLSRVIRSYRSVLAQLETAKTRKISKEMPRELTSKSPSQATTCDFEIETTAWAHGVLDKLKDYKKSRAGTVQLPKGYVELNIQGHFNLKVAMLEMTLTHLYVSVTLKKIQLTYKNRRNKLRAERKMLDEIAASMQRANLILSEFVTGLDAKHIVSFSVKASAINFEREEFNNHTVENRLKVVAGDIEGDMPMHAQNFHEVVLRNVPQLNEQMTRWDYSTPTPVGEYSPHLQRRQAFATVNFDLIVNSIELSAQLLPSLQLKYRLDGAESIGKTGEASKFTARIKSHMVLFTVISSAPPDERRTSILNSDIFTLVLPHISADGAYRPPEKVDIDKMEDENLQFQEGGYIDVVLTVGKLEHMFTTDLLNQILFAEQCFRAELTSLIDRILSDRTPTIIVSSEHPVQSQDPFLFTITIRGETAPWLQLTASTPTSIAVRLTFESIAVTLTNRWTQTSAKTKKKRFYGKANIGVSAKLGQLVKTAMFEEIETELQEYATFMTQITVRNKTGGTPLSHSYVVTVNRPILLIKSSAIDKAILLWLNYKNTYDFWHEERQKMLKSTRRFSLSAQHISTPLTASGETGMDVSLSLKITNGLYICMPLYSVDLSENLSALLVSLQSTDVTVCVRKVLACQATFHNFKVKFINNFDEQTLNDTWIEDDPSDPSRSNYFYFPQGTYQFASRATAAVDPWEKAKWTLSVRWQMRGMIIDLDHRIGKLLCLLVNTFSSLTSDLDEEDWDDTERDSSAAFYDDEEQDADIDATGELGSLAQPEERIQWLERKMHEQSVLVTDLMQCGASEPAVEKERRILRKLESARFRQFRKSMLDKIKRNAMRQRRKLIEPKKSTNGVEAKHISERSFEHQQESSAQTKGRHFGLQLDGLQKGPVETGSSSARSSEGNVAGDTVDMNIDVQVSIESGQCNLRAMGKPDEGGGFAKLPSSRDLRAKLVQSSETVTVTKLAIPSVDVRAYYTTMDLSQFKNMAPPHMHAVFGGKLGRQNRRPAFYLAAGLASMPQESLITPHLADFLEQMLEAIPVNNMDSSLDLSKVDISEGGGTDVAIVEIDTSSIPLDVLFHLTVQSSTIRFEGQQLRTAAADCLLKLPSMILMASTRPLIELTEDSDGDAAGGGIHVCATLSAFSLNIYSPHQRSTAHDALLLTLDHLSILASRSKNSRLELDNKVQFVLTANIGSANFNYDMRRLAELISFPKPWYRRTIVRRLFFGDHSVKTPTVGAEPSRPVSRVSPMPLSPQSAAVQESIKKKEWSATVMCAVEWKELNINAQMANTMGNTKLFVREGTLRGYCQLNSKHDKTISVNFRIRSALLSAHGGAISGEISFHVLQILCKNQMASSVPPRNYAKLELGEVESRIEWMSRPIFIGRFKKPAVVFFDEWSSIADDNGEVLKASVSVNLSCSWDDIQLIITKVTVDDIVKIAQKLQSFFQEQLTNSRMVWGIRSPVGVEETHQEDVDKESVQFTKYRHWQSVLDVLTYIQTRQKLLPMPRGAEGVTSLGGALELNGRNLSLACTHGEMNATSWALFHMRYPSIIFEPEARYAFVTEQKDVGVMVSQRLNIRLGDNTYMQGDTECLAVVCRVQQGRGSMVRQMSSTSACLYHMIGDVLVQLKFMAPEPNCASSQHSVLQLFQFPALDAVLSTVQKQEIESDEDLLTPEVHSSFICEFHDSVNVQTDFNAQITFLPELIKTYMKTQTKEEKAVDVNRDFRHYICERWAVDPKIRFIDRFKWNPPVVDEILKKLQIFDHRTTIPKALQRGLLDPCDALLAQINYAILLIAKKSSKRTSKLKKQ